MACEPSSLPDPITGVSKTMSIKLDRSCQSGFHQHIR